MSLKIFLAKIFSGIKKFFAKIPKPLKDAIALAVIIVDKIKIVVDSPVADIITAIIPGDLDDKIKLALRAALPRILIDLRLANNCGSLTDPNEILKCALDTLKAVSGDIKSQILADLAVMIAQVASDGKLTWDDGAYIVKWFYDHVYKPTQVPPAPAK